MDLPYTLAGVVSMNHKPYGERTRIPWKAIETVNIFRCVDLPLASVERIDGCEVCLDIYTRWRISYNTAQYMRETRRRL